MSVLAIQGRTLTAQMRKDLAIDAAVKAQRVRRELGINPQDPVCVYNAAKHLGVEVRFLDANSMEGMYRKRPSPVIVVASRRPPGRQASTGAHELGHHVYEHGSAVDLVSEAAGQPDDAYDPEEYLVDRFAGFFLMSKTAVMRAFHVRGWDAHWCNPGQVYVVAGYLGVGYSTLVHHMRGSLGLLTFPWAKRLLKVAPKDIRSHILGREEPGNLLVVDKRWTGQRAADVRVGDLLRLPQGTAYEADNLTVVEGAGGHVILRATAPGIGRLHSLESEWAVYARVSRRDYEGRAAYRHLQDPDHEATNLEDGVTEDD
jgi:Zn-dependent peptidase ImmA (M78 family)